jgi:PAS domain S-box-containing protein
MATLPPPETGPPHKRSPFLLGDEQFRLLVEGVRDFAIYMLDPQGCVVSWNAGAAQLKGYTADEIIGSHFSRFYLPEDVARHHPQAELEAALREGRYEEEGWRIRKDGSRFWAHVVLTPLYHEGEHVGFAKVTRDLTARRQAEEANQRLLLAEAARAEAERTVETLRNLQVISEAALAHPTLDQLLPELLSRLRRVLQVDTAVIQLQEAGEFRVRGAAGFGTAGVEGTRTPLGFGLAGRVRRKRHPVAVADVGADAELEPMLRERGLRSLLGVPLLLEGRVTGVLQLGTVSPHRFTAEETAFLQLAADRAALAIQNARLFRESREAEERLFLLTEASGTLLSQLDPEKTHPTLLELAQRLLEADAYAVWRRDAASGVWRIVAQAHLSAEYVATTSGALPSRFDRPLYVPDVFEDARLRHRWDAYRREGIRSLLGCPLLVQEEPAGAITFYRRRPYYFTDADLRVAAALGHLAGSALTTAELYAAQQRLQAETEEARHRLAFLAEASRVLASSLDYEETLKRLSDLLVPHLADWCTVHLVEADGQVRQVAVSHADPAQLEWASSLMQRLYDPEALQGLSYVLRTGQSARYPEVTDALLVQSARSPRDLELLRRIGFSSAMIVPLRARDRVLGAITLVAVESGAHYDAAALAFAEDLARRAADAIDNAQLYRDAQAALEAARQSAARAQRLIESNIIGLHVSRLEGTLTEANDAFLRLVGRSRAELVAGALRWDELVALDYRAAVRQAREQLQATGACTPFELELLRPDGRNVPVLVGAAYLGDPSGETVTFVLDLTEQRRLAEGMRFAMEHAHCLLWHAYVEAPAVPGGPYRWDLQFFDEPAAHRFLPLQLNPGESYVEAFYRHKPPEDRRRVDRNARAAFEGGLPGYEQEYRCELQDGAVRWLEERTYLEQSGPGRWRVVGVCTDLTERKELEEELRGRVGELAEAARRKDEFLAMLAHELRNPLGAVSNAVHVLEQPGQTPDARSRAVRVLRRQIAHQARMVEDLLDVSRLQRGLLELHRSRLDLFTLVGETVEDWRPVLERDGITLSLEAPPEPIWVEGDATRLSQVVDNLLSNAAKFTGSGGQVRVRVEISGPDAVVQVSDTGAGIDADLLPHVFESFTQADRTLARSRGGLGLGLAIVRGVVELHGGSVTAASPGPGLGATLTVRLPRSAAGTEAGATPTAPAPSPASHRILIIEDNRDAAETLQDLLEGDGHQVELAYSGAAGVEAARRWKPEIVLCDIGLPGMDGYQVAAALRSDPQLAGTRLVAITGYGQQEDRRRTREAGFEAHLTKPLDLAELQALLSAKR